MSEYWKSTPKYWCKHCSTYVKDTPFERKQHENTGKHQGNLKRSLRGIQNEHEKNEREKEKAKAEVERLNKVVGGQSALSTGSATSKTNSVRKPATGSLTAVDQKRQWTQLAEMGIEVPDDFRAQMAMPGSWQTISKQVDEPPTSEDSLNIGVRKRKLEDREEEEEEEEIRGAPKHRGWGTTTKRYPGETDSDLDVLLSASIVKKQADSTPGSKPDPDDISTSKDISGILSNQEDVKARQSEGETEDKATENNTALHTDQVTVKSEDVELDRQTALTELPRAAEVPVFKKRKAKSKAT